MKKLTAADRPEFRRAMAGMMQKLDMKVVEIDHGVTIVCKRAADFNPQESVLWELDANKSAVRSDVFCAGCKSTVAMSNHAYGTYGLLDEKPKIFCLQCMTEALEKRDER